jgi:hypothetical protein
MSLRAVPFVLALVASHALASVAVAQTPPPRAELRVDGEGWQIRHRAPGGAWSAPRQAPCLLRVADGTVELGFDDGAADSPSHVRTLEVHHDAAVRVGRWSHDGERTAGGVLVGFGVAGAIGTVAGVVVGAAGCDGFGCTGVGIMAMIGGPTVAVLLAIGLPLLVWPDEPTIEQTSRATDGPVDRHAWTAAEAHAHRLAHRIVGVTSWFLAEAAFGLTFAGAVSHDNGWLFAGVSLIPAAAIGMAVAIGLFVDTNGHSQVPPSGTAGAGPRARVTGGPGEIGLGLALEF